MVRDSTTSDASSELSARTASRRGRAPGLVAIWVAGAPRSIVLPLPDGDLVLGRGSLGELDDPKLSREHCAIGFDGLRWIVRDLGSRNGSFIDGAAVNEPVELQAPRVLRAGDSLFLLCADTRAYSQRSVTVEGDHVMGPRLRQAWSQIARAARGGEIVHLRGETGVGKELAARHFHAASEHRGPFIAVNCAAVPSSVAERLFFGVRRGTYTGADADAEGFVQAADGGTLFLDEIAELDAAVQAKLLRVLETREVVPLGASRPRKVSFRLCSATNGRLDQLVNAGGFRRDLFFRIGRPLVEIAPLRERPEEIPWYVTLALERQGGLRAHASLIEAALLRDWPGNVRELLAEVGEAAGAASEDRSITVRARHLGQSMPATGEAPQLVPDPPADLVLEALRVERGNVSAAARRLQMHRTQLRRLIAKRQIDLDALGRR